MKKPKLKETGMRLSNGNEFSIVHNFKDAVFNTAFDNWLARTKEYTAESFVNYVKSKIPDAIFMTKDQFEKIH